VRSSKLASGISPERREGSVASASRALASAQKSQNGKILPFTKPNFREKSSTVDNIDPIYYEADPIDSSMSMRKAAGSIL
jgi:hypothetical protein